MQAHLANASRAWEQAALLLQLRVRLVHTLHDLGGHLRTVRRANERLDGGELLLPLRVHLLQEREHGVCIRAILHLELIRSTESAEESSGLGLSARTEQDSMSDAAA